jgi:hypothetical protein
LWVCPVSILAEGLPDGVPEGYMIIEGDIIVPDDFFESRTTYATNLWPGGQVPFRYDDNVTDENKTRMYDAMRDWELAANVDFVPRADHEYYIHIQNSSRNSSFVGKSHAGQVVNIHDWDSKYIIVHELGHTLGYWHEQSRADRDTYVQIHWDRIAETCGDTGDQPCDYNFDIREDLGWYGSGEYGPYDFDSVMHYGQCAFSVCGDCGASPATCRTITVRPPNEHWQGSIGQRDHLSYWDGLFMSFLYPFPNYRFVNGAHTGIQLGSFLEPYVSFPTAYDDAPDGGTIWVQPGNYSAVRTYSRPMRIEAPIGAVALGG